MHLHLPKPLHGWREFAGEVGIIVFGVLIALTAEQAAEMLRWRHEIAGFRTAIDREIEGNLGTWKYRLSENACVSARLDELQDWLQSWLDGMGASAKNALVSELKNFWPIAAETWPTKFLYSETSDPTKEPEAAKNE